MTEAVSPAMRAAIRAELDRVAADEGVLILLAVESGSRAWGFHSADSDYDVRFVYARPLSWRFRLDHPRDVIERPIADDLDLSGWELGKALSLALGSNAVLGEWLASPIRYAEHAEGTAALAAFCRRVMTAGPVGWHYRRLAARQLEGLRTPEGRVRLKRYLYAIRPILALRWMRLTGGTMPPMDMGALLAGTALPSEVASYIRALVARKLDAGEMGTAEATDPATDALIAQELEAAAARITASPRAEAAAWEEARDLHLSLSRLVPEAPSRTPAHASRSRSRDAPGGW